MPTIEIFAVRDRATATYGKPFYAPHIGVAIRSFTNEVNRAAPDNDLHNHATDFDLYHLGSYDDQTGRHINHEQPTQIAIGANVRVKE